MAPEPTAPARTPKARPEGGHGQWGLGETEPLNDAAEILERLHKQVQAVVDAGACPMHPSTVLDLTGEEPLLVRRGRGDPSLLGLSVD